MSNKQSVWKKISDKFKGFFNKNKALPEGRGENVELQNRHQKFVKKLQKSNVIEQPVYVENSIENAIQQYLYSYLTQLQNNNVQQGDVAYRALTELAGKKEQDNKSYFAEQESLFSELQKNDYNLQDQAGTFMHIRPLLVINGDKLDAYAKVRGTNNCKKLLINAVKRSVEKFKERGVKVSIGVAGSFLNEKDDEKWFKQVKESFPKEEVYYNSLTLSVASHVGPNAFGVGVSKKI